MQKRMCSAANHSHCPEAKQHTLFTELPVPFAGGRAHHHLALRRRRPQHGDPRQILLVRVLPHTILASSTQPRLARRRPLAVPRAGERTLRAPHPRPHRQRRRRPGLQIPRENPRCDRHPPLALDRKPPSLAHRTPAAGHALLIEAVDPEHITIIP